MSWGLFSGRREIVLPVVSPWEPVGDTGLNVCWVGADLVISPAIGESGWMRPTRIPAFAQAGEEALVAGLPELRRLLGD